MSSPRILALLFAVIVAGPLYSQAEKKPNIIFILADDLGWGDLSCYGNPNFKTPNLDRLAKQGTLFTHFYVNGSVCSPSRSAFFTSRYPSRWKLHGHLATTEQNQVRGMPNELDLQAPTIARLLKAAGYATGHVGKWHLSPPNGPVGPKQYGFDFVGTAEKGGALGTKDDPYFRAKSTALFVDESLDFIKKNSKQPFYLQLWTLVPHATLNPTPDQMKPFEKFSSAGVTHKSPKTIYAASVTNLDQEIGRFMDELEKLGLAENTIVVFSSDNGPEDINILNASHSGVGSAGPFRGRKRSLYEGGVRVPYLVRWPAKVPANRVEDEAVIAGVDFLPTLCTFAGVKLPADFQSDGEDMSDVLLGQSRQRKAPLFWEWRFNIAGEVVHKSPILAVRENQWKLHLNPDKTRIELYDIPRDPSQLQNVADKHPEIVGRLAEKALAWQKTLPTGPIDPNAGKMPYAWPGKNEPIPKKLKAKS